MAKEQWIFHGMSLSQRGKWDVEEVLEGIGIPRYRGSDLQVPFAHGSRWIKKRFDRRKVVLSMWIKGKDRAELDLHIDEFLRRIGSPGQHSLQRILRNGEVREAFGEVSTEIHFVRKGPGYAKFALEVELADPFFYGVNPASENLIISSNPLQWIHSNPGNAQSIQMKISLEGPMSNPVLKNQRNAVWLQYLGSLNAGDTLVIDTKAFTALFNGMNMISALRHGGDPYWMVFESGNNPMELESQAGGGSINIEYYPTFY